MGSEATVVKSAYEKVSDKSTPSVGFESAAIVLGRTVWDKRESRWSSQNQFGDGEGADCNRKEKKVINSSDISEKLFKNVE